MIKNVSFDFDGTLDTNAGLAYASELIKREFNVWIITSRSIELAQESLEMARKLKIPQHQIVYTDNESKKDYFKLHPNFLFHLDDSWIEVKEINDCNLKVQAVSFFGNPEWKEECEQILKKV